MADLVTLAEVKAYAGVSSTNNDTMYSTLIPKVSQYVKNYCGRTLVDFSDVNATAKVETFSGGSEFIYLNEYPLIQLVSVERSLDFGQTYTAMTQYLDYVYDPEFDRIASVVANYGVDTVYPPFILDNTGADSSSMWFPRRINGYKITYFGGYTLVPEDLKLAILDLIIYYSKNDMAVKSTAPRGGSSMAVEYITNAALPSHIRRVLDLYRLI